MQIENEYGNIQSDYGPRAKPYVEWAAAMATSLDTGVPWVMCQQADAPDPIVSCFLPPYVLISSSSSLKISTELANNPKF